MIGGSSALKFVALTVIMAQLRDYGRLAEVYRPATYVMLTVAALSLVLAALAPPPLLFVLAVNVLLSAAWWTGIYQFMRYYAEPAESVEA